MKLLIPSILCSLALFAVSCKNKPNLMQQAHLNGFVLEYNIQGSGEPVLFIHGSAIADTFLALVPESALANYQLIRYNRRGFAGSSGVEAPFTIQDHQLDKYPCHL